LRPTISPRVVMIPEVSPKQNPVFNDFFMPSPKLLRF
jgi:hypothetical protein